MLSYKKIGFLKPVKYEEYRNSEIKTLTFHPLIREVNYVIEQKNTTEFLKKHPIEGVESSIFERIHAEEQLFPKNNSTY